MHNTCKCKHYLSKLHDWQLHYKILTVRFFQSTVVEKMCRAG